MIRSFTRSVFRFFLAALLLLLAVCAGEVGLRVWRLYQAADEAGSLTSFSEFTIPSPISWIDNKPLISIDRTLPSGQIAHIETNELGLRSVPVVIPKPPGVYRILCLGGDEVFGLEVDQRETFPARLQYHLSQQVSQNVEVINAGGPNFGPLINLLRYRNSLSSLQPDLVILSLTPEDLIYDRRLRGSLRLDAAKKPAFAPHPSLISQGHDMVDGLCNEFALIEWGWSWIRKSLAMTPTSDESVTSPTDEQPLMSVAPIVPLYELVSGDHGQLFVSISPHMWGLTPQAPPGKTGFQTLEQDIENLLTRAGLQRAIPVRSTLPAFRELRDIRPYFSPSGTGLSPQGNDLYAQIIARQLLESLPASAPTAPSTNAAPVKNVPAPIPYSKPTVDDPFR